MALCFYFLLSTWRGPNLFWFYLCNLPFVLTVFYSAGFDSITKVNSWSLGCCLLCDQKLLYLCWASTWVPNWQETKTNRRANHGLLDRVGLYLPLFAAVILCFAACFRLRCRFIIYIIYYIYNTSHGVYIMLIRMLSVKSVDHTMLTTCTTHQNDLNSFLFT